MKEYQNSGIVPVIKHFPGHGATNLDSHLFLPVINMDMKKFENEHMYPFMKAIENDADAVLVSHLIVRKQTGIYPVSLSRRFIVKYLRKKYRFKGLIITDDLKMRSIRFIYGPIFAVEKAFRSGNDIILFRFKEKDERRAFKRIYFLAKHKLLKEREINRSVNRILKIKEKYNISDEINSSKLNIDEINEKIQNIRDKANI